MIKNDSGIQGKWIENRKKIICSILLTLMLVVITGLLVFNLALNDTILNQEFHTKIQEETNFYRNLQKNVQNDLNLLMKQEGLSVNLVSNLITYEEVKDVIQTQTKELSDFHSGKISIISSLNFDKIINKFEVRMTNSGEIDGRISENLRKILNEHLQLVPEEMYEHVEGIVTFIKNIYVLRSIFTVPLLSITICLIIATLAYVWKNNIIDVLLYLSISGFISGLLITFIFLFRHKIMFSTHLASSIVARKNLYAITFNHFIKKMYTLGWYVLLSGIVCLIILIMVKEIRTVRLLVSTEYSDKK